jgi:ribosome biogenesis protein Nip4
MSSQPVFHLATKNQLQKIRDGLNHISPQIWSSIGEEPLNIYVRYTQNADVYLVPSHMERQLKIIQNYNMLHHTGIYIGFLHKQKNEFLLSLEGAEFLFYSFFKKNLIKLKTIIVTDEAANSFLYGNTLKTTDFTQAPKILNRKDVIFVLNPHKEFIGIGYIYKREDRTELRNLVDYGYYIRRGH